MRSGRKIVGKHRPKRRPQSRGKRPKPSTVVIIQTKKEETIKSEKTNILLIHSDQHRFDCVGVNKHPLLETPNLDRLACEGMNFTHAFTPIPLCVPARNCLLHGQWPGRHQAIANWDTEAPRPPGEGLPCFSKPLHDHGYYLGYVGKWHVHPVKNPRDYGFDVYVPEDAYEDWRVGQGVPPRPQVNEFFGEVDPCITPEQSRLAWGADHAMEMIRQATERTQPFFIRWDPSEPHLPNVVPEPYASMYPPEQVPPWPSYPDDFRHKPYIQAQQLRTWKIDQWSWRQWAPIVARYLGEISLLDAQLGRILACLDERGLADNTLVVYTTDHGDMCGGHGMIDKHFVMYDDVVHVPFLARWPARIRPETVCDAFVSSSIDLASTFCDVAGVPIPETFQGQSLMPLMAGQSGNGRQDIFSSYHGNQFGLFSQRMIRNRRWKYVWNAVAEDELYDLECDPGELCNRALTPECAGELARLRHRLLEWMSETSDPLLNYWIRTQLLEGRKR